MGATHATSIPARPAASASAETGRDAPGALGGGLAAPPPLWASVLGKLAGALLGVVLLVAVWAKAIDPNAFAQQIHAEGLDRFLPAGTMALIALALEAALGTGLLLGLRRLWLLVPAACLVSFFLFLTGHSYWLAAHGHLAALGASCGCFGNLVERTPAQAFWLDLLVLLPPLLLAFLGRDPRAKSVPPVRTAAVAMITLAVVLFARKAPELPLDDLATKLHPSAQIASLCAGAAAPDSSRVCLDEVAPELRQGDHLVVLADLDDPALGRAVDALNAHANAPGAPSLLVLSSSGADRQRAFFWKWAPTFKLDQAPPELLRPLYRRLPRSFRVQDGRVTATYSGLPPLSSPAPGRQNLPTPSRPSR